MFLRENPMKSKQIFYECMKFPRIKTIRQFFEKGRDWSVQEGGDPQGEPRSSTLSAVMYYACSSDRADVNKQQLVPLSILYVKKQKKTKQKAWSRAKK